MSVSGQHQFRFGPERLLRSLLDDYRRPIREHLGHTLHEFGGVITRADYGICAQFSGMAQHQVKGVVARLFAQVGQQGDIAPHQGLQSRANRSENGTRAHHDASHYAEGPDNAISGYIESS